MSIDEAINSKSEDCCAAAKCLPEEVWTHVFQFLPLSDRKNANLVCKQWYDASNNITILQHELVVIDYAYSAPEILDMLTSSKRRFMNLEFRGIRFDEHFTSLWDACGSKIVSINFFNCVLDDENFGKVIETCENLTHLGWHYTESNIDNRVPNEKQLCSDSVLRNLVQKKIVRKKLLSLCMYLDKISRISTYTLPLIMMVFTHARKFAFNFEKSDVNFHNEATESDMITSYTIIDKLISLSDEITKVNLLLPASNNQIYYGFTCDSPEPIADLLRCKEIPIDLSVNGSTWMKMNEFCIRRKNLTDIECALKSEPLEPEKVIFARQFLLDVLRECPKLRHLKLSIMPSCNFVEMNSELFEVLLTSDLISLDLDCGVLRMHLTDSRASPDEFPMNVTMRSLKLNAGFMQHEYAGFMQHEYFIKRFQGLHHLEIHRADHCGLQTIWEYQANLSHLDLEAVSAYTLSFTGPNAEPVEEEVVFEAEQYDYLKYKQFCIDRLENLQSLTITAYEPDWNAGDAIFNYFNFPKLRFLHLEILDNAGLTRPMLSMIRRLPLLEVIILGYNNEVRYQTWLELCSNMKHLRCLNIINVAELHFTESEFVGLFDVCPTLRTVVQQHYEGYHWYYYNVVQKKALKRRSGSGMVNCSLPLRLTAKANEFF